MEGVELEFSERDRFAQHRAAISNRSPLRVLEAHFLKLARGALVLRPGGGGQAILDLLLIGPRRWGILPLHVDGEVFVRLRLDHGRLRTFTLGVRAPLHRHNLGVEIGLTIRVAVLRLHHLLLARQLHQLRTHNHGFQVRHLGLPLVRCRCV